MKVILADGVKKYNERPSVERSELQKFIQSHRFYKSNMPLPDLLSSLDDMIKKNHHSGSRGHTHSQSQQKQESLHQLSLYLNRDNNKQIFSLFEHVLNHPKGITYDSLSKKLKTDIITVSHYCCKLKKLRLVDWDHEKQGVVVFPRVGRRKEQSLIQYTHIKNEITFDLNESFFFKQLSMTENIWINLSGEESIAHGGMTNEEVKRKIMKHAENKMVRRTVESMKFLDKNAQRQGKVFEFKYKNQTELIKNQILNKHQDCEPQTQIEALNPTILDWLQNKFPQFQGEQFLLKLINQKFKDYLTILGVKQSKRQCTPLKLNRYVKVLNYLHLRGGLRQSDLRALIVKDETQFNVGVMHKRSLMGILQGLKNLQIIYEEEDHYYYPGWVSEQNWFKKEDQPKKIKQDQYEEPLKKKIHFDFTERTEKKGDKINKQGKVNGIKKQLDNTTHYNKISQKDYKSELFTAVLTLTLQKAVNFFFRKAFNRIVYVQRKKNVQKYIPQLNVLHLLQSDEKPSLNFNLSLKSFYEDLDLLIEQRGEKQEIPIEVENQLIKFIRKNPTRNANFLRIKYGKSWSSKFDPLQKAMIVKSNVTSLSLIDEDRFLI